METVLEAFRKKYAIHLQAEWLQACLDFLARRGSVSSLSPADHAALIHEQLLYADLRHAIRPSVDRCHAGLFQVMDVLDVGTSLSVQIERIKTDAQTGPQRVFDAEGEDAMTGPSSLATAQASMPSAENAGSDRSQETRRCLRLRLHDGARVWEAIEMEPLPQLSYPMPPGAKIRVDMGKVKVHKEVLMLKPRVVEYLGGSWLDDATGQPLSTDGHLAALQQKLRAAASTST